MWRDLEDIPFVHSMSRRRSYSKLRCGVNKGFLGDPEGGGLSIQKKRAEAMVKNKCRLETENHGERQNLLGDMRVLEEKKRSLNFIP